MAPPSQSTLDLRKILRGIHARYEAAVFPAKEALDRKKQVILDAYRVRVEADRESMLAKIEVLELEFDAITGPADLIFLTELDEAVRICESNK